MKILEYIKKLFNKEPERNFGVLESDIELIKDNSTEQAEIVAKIAIPTFKGVNNDGSIRKFPYQYQDGSSSCVAHTMAKIATVLYYNLKNTVTKFSPGFFYTQRSNKPDEGMSILDVRKLGHEKGCLPHDFMPCNGYSESLMNALDVEPFQLKIAEAFKLPEGLVVTSIDFDTVASTIEQTKKPIMLWFKFGSGEFFYTSYPKVLNNNPWVHSVTAVDTTTIKNEKYIVIEDSADYEANYIKFISKDFFSKKCILSVYSKNFEFALESDVKPKFDGSVKSLQDILIYEGLLPTDCNTGYFGTKTKQALITFQKNHGISPAIGVFGNITKQFLSENYQ
jgi:hypothetical protein